MTPEQQAYAENLVAVTLVRLPQWSDPAVAEAAGFHSIGDAGTGHEHYVQWDWINDDVWLDPDAPESLVYEPQPDGSKKLVSAMYMLPTSVALTDVPDLGGRLMQWHIHDNLCYTDDPVAPQVGGLTRGRRHVPAAAREARPCADDPRLDHAARVRPVRLPRRASPPGSIAEGQERWCDHAPRLLNRRWIEPPRWRDNGDVFAVVVIGLVVAVAAAVTVDAGACARTAAPSPATSTRRRSIPADVAELTARFARVEADRSAMQRGLLENHLRPLVTRRVPVRCIEVVPQLRTTRVRFADGTAVVVRGEAAGDAGVLASVVRQHRVLPADYRTDDAGTHLVFDWFDGRRHMSLLVTGLDQPD